MNCVSISSAMIMSINMYSVHTKYVNKFHLLH